MTNGRFPADFMWGTTSSSTGTEGAAPAADWTRWERTGRAAASRDGSGWRSDYADDIALMASLGLNSLRLTLEWARLEPEPGRIDGRRVEHERLVLEAARAAGVQPWLTLHNTTLPGWFADDEGGFRDDRARNYFWARHVDRCAEWFDDLAAGWTPMEDPVGWALRGFLRGVRPPGRTDPEAARDAVLGALEANQVAWQLLSSGTKPVMAVFGLPSVFAADDASRTEASHWRKVLWETPLRARRDGILTVPGGPELERPDMQGSFDLLGIAFDHPVAVHVDGKVGPYPATARVDQSGFAPNPSELGEVLQRVAHDVPGVPLVVASNGVATDDDAWREELLRSTVDVLAAVRDAGVEVKGWFYDTGVDGYEWNHGFDTTRGLVTRDRTVKPSARWLQSQLAP